MSYKAEVTPLIRQFVSDIFYDYDEFKQTLSKIPRPYFESEEDAYNSLQELVQYIQKSNDEFDCSIRFILFDIPELYLQEADSYRLFWELSKPFNHTGEHLQHQHSFYCSLKELLTGCFVDRSKTSVYEPSI